MNPRIRAAPWPTYPAGETLRQVRRDCDLLLREAAKALRLTTQEIDDLEMGRAVFADEFEWQAAYRALRAAEANR